MRSETKSVVNRWKRAVAVAGVASVALVVGGCAAQSTSDDDVIRIGAVLPLTGPAAFFGPLQQDGIELRLEEAGAKVAGKTVEVIFIDSGPDLGVALPRVQQLVERDGVSAVIGPLQSDILAGLLPYYTTNKVPVVSLLNHPREFEVAPYLFTPQGSLAGGAAPMGDYAASELGVTTATVQASDYLAGQDVALGFEEGFTAAGGEVIQTQFTPLSNGDFGPVVANLDTSADALVTWNVGTTQNFMAEYTKRDQLDHTFLGYGDALTESQLNEIGDASIGWMTPLSYTWRLDTPESAAFTEAVREAYGRDPVAQIDEAAYEAMSLILAALEETGGDTDPDALAEAMRGIELSTPAGKVRFDDHGFGIRSVYILEAQRVEDGTIGWVPIETYEEVGGKE